MSKNHLLFFPAMIIAVMLCGCDGDEILMTDGDTSSGSGSSTELTDPSLVWSASKCTAILGGDSNTYPTLTNKYGVSVVYASSSEEVAIISSSGQITLKAEGKTTITATSAQTAQYESSTASYTLTVNASSDEGGGDGDGDGGGDPVNIVFESSGASDDDDISLTTFTRLITVSYSGTTASVTGYSGLTDVMDVTVSGAGVTINYTGSESVVYKLTGTSGNGFFKLYSSKKQALWLSGLSLTCTTGAAINNQSGKRTFIFVDGANSLADGSSAAYSTTGDEDMKAVFFSEGQLIFSGPSGSANQLTVTADNSNGKSGIVSDDYIRTLANASISVSAGTGAGHGIKANDYMQISDGTLSITATAATKKGIASDNYVLVEGGTTTIDVSGGIAFDSDASEYKGSAGIKADNYFAMTGGSLTITNTANGGKGIKAGSYDYYSANDSKLTDSYISGGTLYVSTTGIKANNVEPKAIKIGFKERVGNGYTYSGNLNVSGGTIVATCAKSETIEVKGTLTISDGSLYSTSTFDDAINSQGEIKITGGYIYANTTRGDGIDTNSNLRISGGYVFAVTTNGSPEVALDANSEGGYKIYITGGTIVAYGGLERGYSTSNTVYNMSCTAGSWNALYGSSGFIAAFKAPGGCSTVAVASSGLSKGYKSVSVSGTTYCNGIWATSGISGGSSVSLSTYSGGGGGPGGW